VIALGELAFDLLERPAEFRQRLARDADAAIGDGEHDRAVAHPAAHGDLAIVGGELHRIGQKVDRDLLHGAAVGNDRDRAADIGIHCQVLVFCPAGDDAQGLGQGLRQVERLVIELHASGFDLRHVENIVDDVQQVVSAGHDVVAVLLILLGAERAEHAAAHHFRKPDNGVQRGAQFVAHVGEEF